MPFTEVESGGQVAQYQITATHAATGLTVYVTLWGDANGVIPESDADQVILDLSEVVVSDLRFQNLAAIRSRQSRDSWAPPTPTE